MEDSLITVKEVAEYLKLKEQTVYLLARQNKIPSLKVGGSLRFRKSQIDGWLLAEPKKISSKNGPGKVLIVEDQRAVRDSLQGIVQLHGIAAVAVPDGPRALEAVRRESFRMVFLDLNLPRMDSVETLRELRSLDRKLVFVVVTDLPGENPLFQSAVESAPVSVVPRKFTSEQIGDVLELHFDELTRSNPTSPQT
jgi:excisionase family DNA binding protein